MNNYNFQNCQKIVVFSNDMSKVLLCKRKGEQDYDGIFSFIGGKMENTDASIIEGLRREKEEEVGKNFKIKICSLYSTSVLYRKKDGNAMILPHYYAVYVSGNIELSEEYSEYKWVNIKDLEEFEPKIETIPEMVKIVANFRKIIKEEDLVVI